MVQAAAQEGLDPNRLSFTHAVQVLERAAAVAPLFAPTTVPTLCHHILQDLRDRATLLPPQRLRFYPRVLKRAFPPFQRKQLWHVGFTLKGYTFKDVLLISMASAGECRVVATRIRPLGCFASSGRSP